MHLTNLHIFQILFFQTYKELMDLAEKGNDRNVNCYISDLAKPSEEGKVSNVKVLGP